MIVYQCSALPLLSLLLCTYRVVASSPAAPASARVLVVSALLPERVVCDFLAIYLPAVIRSHGWRFGHVSHAAVFAGFVWCVACCSAVACMVVHNESLQRTAGFRFSRFVAQWPAAAEFGVSRHIRRCSRGRRLLCAQSCGRVVRHVSGPLNNLPRSSRIECSAQCRV
jgi:hypothetical protein